MIGRNLLTQKNTNPLKMVKYKTAFLCSFMLFLCENVASGLTGSVVYSFSSVQLETFPPTRYFVFHYERSKS